MNKLFACLTLALLLVAPAAWGQSPPAASGGPTFLTLSAVLGGTQKPVVAGLHWRLYREAAEVDGSHVLVAESIHSTPTLQVADGQYILHLAFGLASVTKRIAINGNSVTEKLVLNAGGIIIAGMLGDKPIPPDRLKLSIFVPERGNSEAKLVFASAKAGDLVALPEGTYHIVSTYLDIVGIGAQDGPFGASKNATNSIVAADLRVVSGKVVKVSLRHRAALLTLKLVNQPGGEAMANTSFTVLTPGGDVIRELIGAFPSLILAEGEYAGIARHDGKTFQSTFKVESTLDRDVEIIAR